MRTRYRKTKIWRKTMSKKLGMSTVFLYALVAAIAFVLVMATVYPLVVPIITKLLGIAPTPPAEVPPGYIYSGNLKVNLNTYDLYDDNVQNPDDAVDIKIFHADGVTIFGTATTLDGSDAITGQVYSIDRGILYLAVDHDSGTTEYFLDTKSAQVSATYLTALAPKDIDADGVLEHYWKLDVTSLAPLQAGETQKEITLNLYCMPADVTGLDWTATINPTSADLSGAAYIDLTAEGYMTAVTEGTGFKVVRVELTLPTAGNETYVEDGKVKNVWVQIGTNRWTVLTWQPAQDRFLVWAATDVTQEVYGKDFFYARGVGTTWLTYKVHIQGANFAALASWNPTLKITVINPAGTISTITEAITFTDT